MRNLIIFRKCEGKRDEKGYGKRDFPAKYGREDQDGKEIRLTHGGRRQLQGDSGGRRPGLG